MIPRAVYLCSTHEVLIPLGNNAECSHSHCVLAQIPGTLVTSIFLSFFFFFFNFHVQIEVLLVQRHTYLKDNFSQNSNNV